MIIIENKGSHSIPDVLKALSPAAMQFQVHVMDERPAVALTMLQEAYRVCIDLFIQDHNQTCKIGAECAAVKTAENMKFHFKQMDEEVKTIVLTSKSHDKPSDS